MDTKLHVKVWNVETNQWDEHGAYETWSEASVAMYDLMMSGRAVSLCQCADAPNNWYVTVDKDAPTGRTVEWNPEWLAKRDGKA